MHGSYVYHRLTSLVVINILEVPEVPERIIPTMSNPKMSNPITSNTFARIPRMSKMC